MSKNHDHLSRKKMDTLNVLFSLVSQFYQLFSLELLDTLGITSKQEITEHIVLVENAQNFKVYKYYNIIQAYPCQCYATYQK